MLNTAVLMGRLTYNPDIKQLDTGKKVIKLNIAVERSRASPNGEKQVDFFDCVAWESTAEFIFEYFAKGDPIIVEGRIETRQYEDRQGIKKKAFEIIVKNVNFCAFKRGEDTKSKTETNENKENNDLLDNQDLPF
ncbi:MAG: single-stranded DNA-binding protein [Oscillospiraceae bacterium]|jgi:single-strand DNA-binding protein|nr:single-stranded DNA-binding protein [Oscillospiraceae bacterium]